MQFWGLKIAQEKCSLESNYGCMISCIEIRGIKLEFYNGFEQFISVACQTQQFIGEGKVRGYPMVSVDVRSI